MLLSIMCVTLSTFSFVSISTAVYVVLVAKFELETSFQKLPRFVRVSCSIRFCERLQKKL